MRLIINADDLGYNQKVNDAIFDLMAEGRITSATIMANGEAVEDAAKRASGTKDCSFGVHLDIHELAPLTSNPALQRIMDPRGWFNGSVRDIRITSDLQHAVGEEWRAQVAKLRSLGVQISHIDSHHHTHTIPALFRTLKDLQRDTGIWKVRATHNIYPNNVRVSLVKMMKKWLWAWALRNWRRTKTVDGFTDFATLLAEGSRRKVPHEVVEAMVHPGYPKYAVEETAALRTDWQKSLLGPVEMISYWQL